MATGLIILSLHVPGIKWSQVRLRGEVEKLKQLNMSQDGGIDQENLNKEFELKLRHLNYKLHTSGQKIAIKTWNGGYYRWQAWTGKMLKVICLNSAIIVKDKYPHKS